LAPNECLGDFPSSERGSSIDETDRRGESRSPNNEEHGITYQPQSAASTNPWSPQAASDYHDLTDNLNIEALDFATQADPRHPHEQLGITPCAKPPRDSNLKGPRIKRPGQRPPHREISV